MDKILFQYFLNTHKFDNLTKLKMYFSIKVYNFRKN